MTDTREVCHRADLDFVLDLLDELDGLLARRSPRAVGDRNIARPQRAQVFDRLVKQLEPGLGLRREELEADGRLTFAEDLVDAHGYGSISAGTEEAENAKARRS